MELYPGLKLIHITTAAITIGLFALRMGLSLKRPYASLPRTLRVIPHINDTILLASALALAALSQQYPVSQPWLTAKLVALPVYIALGSIALKQARGVTARLGWGLAALATVTYIVLVAMNRQVWPF